MEIINLGAWGIAPGLPASFSSCIAMLVQAHYWTSFSERFGKYLFKKESEGENNNPDY